MNSLSQDLLFAIRQFRRAPAFSAICVLTLALSVAIATAVFSVVDATIVRPLPYSNPDSIVLLQPYSPQGYAQPASFPQYLDWRQQNTTLAELAGYNGSTSIIEGPQGPASVNTLSCSDNFFRVFGIAPILGRTFAPGEDQQGRNRVSVLSYDLWQQSFGGDPRVVGTSITVDGKEMTIIGVMPAGFRFPLGTLSGGMYLPFDLSDIQVHARDNHWLPTVARLKPGVTAQQAMADINNVFINLARIYPDEASKRAQVQTIRQALLGETSGPLAVLSLAVLGVLAIGCVNIAGLLLARGLRRERELSVRFAAGATRSRIIRQLLTEALVFVFAGAVLGIGLAFGLLQTLRQLLIASLARGADVHLNLTVLAAALVIAALTGVAASLFPAIHLSRISPTQALRTSISSGTTRRQNALRSAVITVQVAIAFSLLICSTLLLHSIHTYRSIDLGFSSDKLLIESIDLTPVNYAGRDVLTAFYRPLLEQVRAIPGVSSAALINMVPIESTGMNTAVQIVGHSAAPPNEERLAEMRLVTPDTARVFGASLLRGRFLDDALDTPTSPRAVTVNQAFVDRFFSPGEDPIGKQIEWEPKATIVGVTSDLRQQLTQRPLPEMDFSVQQQMKVWGSTSLSLVIRTKVAPDAMETSLRETIHKLDPTVPFHPPETVDAIISEILTFVRLESWLFGIFAGLAFAVSLVGIYGMVQHEVELRTRDIGIRMALGSTRAQVMKQIVSRIALLMCFGTIGGLTLTFVMQKVLASVVKFHAARDGGALLELSAVVIVIGVAACIPSARRAATIDPMKALRSE